MKYDYDRAIADSNKAIEIDPKFAPAYHGRGGIYWAKGEYDSAIADYTKAIEINPKAAYAYGGRGFAYASKGDYDRAIADATKAIEIDPKEPNAYASRCKAYRSKGDNERAIADCNKLIELYPKEANGYSDRGNAYRGTGEYDRSIADLTRAIELDPDDLRYFAARAQSYEAKGDRDKAIEDYNRALTLPAEFADAKTKQSEASKRLAALRGAPPITASVPTAAPPVAAVPLSGRETRLALVISNATYPAEIGTLDYPHKDSAVIALALQGVGFEEHNVTLLKDADQSTMRMAIAVFVERIENAGSDAVAFLYYSGHGAADRTERGENYLIPVGAKITAAKQLPILGIGLSEITKALERVPAKARFVVIDACRNVAFTKGRKDATKGFVPERKLDGMIVAFATRPGETAEDNNVYASALASILPTPGLESEQVFKETQRKVAELTKGTQIPWTEDGLLTRFRFK
jgi:tetratricopeptide (TPR) repeat protein